MQNKTNPLQSLFVIVTVWWHHIVIGLIAKILQA